MRKSNPIAPEMEDFNSEEEEEAVVVAAPRRRRAATERPRVVPDPEGPRRQKKTAPRQSKAESPKEPANPFAFLKDYRLHLGIGIFLCLASLVSMVMCISFIDSNEADQSTTGQAVETVVENQDTVQNAGYIIGAKIAHVLMVDTLGVGSFLIAFYVFVLGLACMRFVKIRFWSLSFRCLFPAAAISVIVGMLTMNRPATFPLGGVHGQYINEILISYSGALGAYAVSVLLAGLLVAVFLNPLKNLCEAIKRLIPERKPEDEAALNPDSEAEAQPTLEKLDQEAADSKVPAESAEENTPEDQEEKPADETGEHGGPDDLSVLGPEEGFAIDDVADAATEEHGPLKPADEVPKSEQTSEADLLVIDSDNIELLDSDRLEAVEEDESEIHKAAVAAATTAMPAAVAMPSVPGEPEMIIKTPDEPEAKPIRDGDHFGLDTVFDPRAEHSAYKFPSTDLLLERDEGVEINAEEQASNKQMIVNALRSFGIEIVRIEATIGPTVTLYEIVPSEGTRIAKIKSLEDDIAMNLSALGIRIIAPIPGKGTIGIEVPNREKKIVSMRRVIESAAFQEQRRKMQLPVAFGSTISNKYFVKDICKMPHLLVAGATGQGKSVGLNCIITSLLYSKHPDELKFVLVDPKMVEFSLYRGIGKAFMAKLPEEENPILTDPQKVVQTLNSLCTEMDRRYLLMSEANARDIVTYNDRFIHRRLNPEKGHRFMPYIVMIVDEFADLITTAGRDVSVFLARLAQKGRAAGMHIILATQRPSTDVINGMIKANFPARIAFRVLSSIDSKTILDRPGAHRLIGRGDMLTLIDGTVERVQCAFVDTDEIEAICDHISSQPGFVSCYELPEVQDENGNSGGGTAEVNLNNEEFNRCALFTATQSQASITILQRKFQIGFNKAGRYMDQMETLGIVGPANGAKPRQVLMTLDEVQRLIAEAR